MTGLVTPLIDTLPNTLTNGTPADATQVMANFNTIANDVNNRINTTAGAQYSGIVTDTRWGGGTSVQDALGTLIDKQQLTDTGSVNALVVTPAGALFTANVTGMFFLVKPGNQTTSTTPTLKVGSAPALTIVNHDGTTHVAGSIQVGRAALFWIDTANSLAIHLNPTKVTTSVSMTLTGMAGATSGTVNAIVMPGGTQVQVSINADISGTSNSTAMTGTGIPAFLAIASGASSKIIILGQDNSVRNIVTISGFNGTVWTFLYTASLNGWTASGTKGIFACMFSYGSA